MSPKSGYKYAIAVSLAFMAAVLTGCAELESALNHKSNSYSTARAESPPPPPPTVYETLAVEGYKAAQAGDFATAEAKYKKIIDTKVCDTVEAKHQKDCPLVANRGLAQAYSSQGKHKEALQYHKKLADMSIGPSDSNLAPPICTAKLATADTYMKLKRGKDAFPYYMSARDMSSQYNNACSDDASRAAIQHGLADSAATPGQFKSATAVFKPMYYANPASDVTADYVKVLRKAGSKKELRNVETFQSEIMAKINRWEKLNAPTSSYDEDAVIRYNAGRATIYNIMINQADSLKLTGYDDFLIARVRESRGEVDSINAQRRYQQEIEQMNAEQEARDAEMVDMFMNILQNSNRY